MGARREVTVSGPPPLCSRYLTLASMPILSSICPSLLQAKLTRHQTHTPFFSFVLIFITPSRASVPYTSCHNPFTLRRINLKSKPMIFAFPQIYMNPLTLTLAAYHYIDVTKQGSSNKSGTPPDSTMWDRRVPCPAHGAKVYSCSDAFDFTSRPGI